MPLKGLKICGVEQSNTKVESIGIATPHHAPQRSHSCLPVRREVGVHGGDVTYSKPTLKIGNQEITCYA